MQKRKETLLFIPGLICDHELWMNQIEAFEGDYHIEVADHSGSEDFEEVARQILAAAPDEFYLIGLSMGGYLAQQVIHQAPNRVKKLCLMATSARLDSDDMRRKRRGMIDLAQRVGRFKGMSPMMLKTFVHPSKVNDPNVADVVYRMAENTGREKFIRQQTAILHRPHLAPYLKDISVPTLILCGDTDERTPVDYHQQLADEIAGAEWHVIEECGHLPPLEQPEVVNAYLCEWLAK